MRKLAAALRAVVAAFASLPKAAFMFVMESGRMVLRAVIQPGGPVVSEPADYVDDVAAAVAELAMPVSVRPKDPAALVREYARAVAYGNEKPVIQRLPEAVRTWVASLSVYEARLVASASNEQVTCHIGSNADLGSLESVRRLDGGMRVPRRSVSAEEKRQADAIVFDILDELLTGVPNVA